MIRAILNGTTYPENYFSWQERKEVIARSETFHGVITTTNLDLQFIGDACDMLMALDSEFDVAAECTIDIQTFDQIEGWQTEWSGYLDFKTFKVNTTDGLKCTVSAYDTGFSNKLLERMEIEIPYDRLETLDGATITPFTNEYQTVNIDGIDACSEAFGTGNDIEYNTQITPQFSMPINITSGNANAKTVPFRDIDGPLADGDFIYIAKTNATTILDITLSFSLNYGAEAGRSIMLYLSKHEYDEENVQWIFKETIESQIYDNISNPGVFIYEGSIILNKNQSLLLGGAAGQNTNGIIIHGSSVINIKISELAAPTPCEFVPYYEAGTRILEAITGEANALDSSYLGRTDSPTVYDEDGEGSTLFLTNGKLIRQFPKGYNIDKGSQLTFSLKDWFESIDKIKCIGAGVRNGKLYVDKRENFYLSDIVVTFDKSDIEADSFEVERILDHYFNEIEIGSEYEAPEEISGLEEYNGVQKYSTPVLNENLLELINKYIYAAYPFEFARRKPYDSSQTEDYKYDGNNFILKVLRGESGFIQHSDEGFTEILGLDGVTHFINLDITPKRNLFNWSWFINTGLKGYQSSKLTYNKSDVVTDLSTTIGANAPVVECSDLDISYLSSPKFTGRVVRFSAAIGSSRFNLIKANPYGLIEYYSPITETYGYGYLKEVSTSLIDKKTNVELYEASGAATGEGVRLLQDGTIRLLENNAYRLLE